MPAHSKEDSTRSATGKTTITTDQVKGISTTITIASMATTSLHIVMSAWKAEEVIDIIEWLTMKDTTGIVTITVTE
ncbi:MAG TPA: hypothetical protein VL093_02445 [Flavipsychrobacter sp.]|nr:hypothetical protein [Flavipsychrobacter sp.]